MNRRTFILASCAGPFSQAQAQAGKLSNEAIRDILSRRIDVDKRATGMAVGIVERGRRRVILYGKQDSGDAPPITSNTLFEIGSMTKVFTALLLADMVHRKQLRFDDLLDRCLPFGFRTPQHNGRAITLADLATHTSGLPIFPPLAGNPLEAMGRYTVADLRAWLAEFSLLRDPGTQFAYSNVGYCLLGLALANMAGTTYDDLLQHRILAPLKLKDTVLHPAYQLRQLAKGHDPRLVPIPPLEIGIFSPAGALRSTVDNLLTFANAVLPTSHSPLEAPAQLLLSIRRPAPAVGGDQALGWEVVGGTNPFLAKDGVTGGQAATIVLDPARQTGVVVLSNAFPVDLKPAPNGGVGAADLARHLLRPELPLE